MNAAVATRPGGRVPPGPGGRGAAGRRSTHGHAHGFGRSSGQAAVEVALALPVLAVLALGLLQEALVVRDQVLVVHAAREAAREAAVSDDPNTVTAAARDATALDADRLHVVVGPRGATGARVRVELRYRSPTDVPVVGRALGDVNLHATAVMRVER